MFEEDDTVFYFSTHQFPFYPGTGAASETGRGRGAGFTLNVPMAAGSGDREYARVFREVLSPAIDRFGPDFILISAGFDAHARDPLGGGGQSLEAEDFAWATRAIASVANRHAKGRVVSSLEGGYDLGALGSSALAHVRALSEG